MKKSSGEEVLLKREGPLLLSFFLSIIFLGTKCRVKFAKLPEVFGVSHLTSLF